VSGDSGETEAIRDGIAVRSRGFGDGVLWVHGYTLDSTIWDPLWQRLPGFRHVGLDLPGHGRSHALAPGTTLVALGAVVDAVARTYDVQHVVGLSFGGMLALQAACDAPERYASIALASPGLAGGPLDAEAGTCNLELMALARERGVGPWLAERWLAVPPQIFAGARARPELFAALERVVARHRWSELLDGAMAPLQAAVQTTESLARIRAPLTIVLGDDDIDAFKRCAHLIARAVPRTRRVYLDETGHLSILEDPDAGAAALAEAFARSSEPAR
jgi:pimeloyl-ACP methyl ester carboxylesterase